jgi:ESS family glutamate:Na+ symporter
MFHTDGFTVVNQSIDFCGNLDNIIFIRMQEFTINGWQTVMVSILVLFLGRRLNRWIPFLSRFNIPEAVSSGLLISMFIAVLYAVAGLSVKFDLFYRDVLLVVFFTTVGISASIRDLARGGRPMLILLLLSVMLIFVQNGVGVALAGLLGIDRNIGLLGGSISLVGGLGTSIAWGSILSAEYGTALAMEIGVACATIGLIMGGLTGGPIAQYLIRKGNLKPEAGDTHHIHVSHGEEVPISEDAFLHTVFIIGLAIGLGMWANSLLASTSLRLPQYVTCMFAGILLSNTVPLLFRKIDWPTRHASLDFLSEISLGLFLTMSLMSLQLLNLVNLAAPIVLIVAIQVLIVVGFCIFLVFPALKRNYNAAVISAGFAGFTLGATPNAVANMQSVTNRFGPAPFAFIIVPLVGGFFIDLVNALVIELFLLMP